MWASAATRSPAQVARQLNGMKIPSVQDLYEGDWTGFDYLHTTSFYAGEGKGKARWQYVGNGFTPTNAGTLYTDLAQRYLVDQAGNKFQLYEDQAFTLFMFGGRMNWNGTTGHDDSDAFETLLDACSDNFDYNGRAKVARLGQGVMKLSRRVDAQPAVRIKGECIYQGNMLTAATCIWKTHDGAALRFVRNSVDTTLYHNGAIQGVWFTGNGELDTTASRFIELGDPANVDAHHGAWNGKVHECGFNNTYGYAIYSAHSQEWKFHDNFFRNTRYSIWYETVAASAHIFSNTFALTNAGLQAYGIVMLRGTLGGTAGANIEDNYFINGQTAVWLSNQIGVTVRGNTMEGCGYEAIVLTKKKLDGSNDTAEASPLQSGCKGCTVEDNTMINWNSDGTAGNSIRRYCILVEYSTLNMIGKNTYISPNAYSPGAIGLAEDGTDLCRNNWFVQPVIQGNNAGSVPGWNKDETLWQRQSVWRQDGIKLALNAYTGTRGVADMGHIFMDSNANVNFWDGAANKKIMVTDQALSGSAGALTAYLAFKLGATTYKIPVHLAS